ncbi:hypothetical protein ACFL4U_03175 [Candidatus Neomarinimicrobiota bacterium]
MDFKNSDVNKALPRWIDDIRKMSRDPFVSDVIALFHEIDQFYSTIPEEYEWRFIDSDNFNRQAITLTNPDQLNKYYWEDQIQNIRAYLVITCWRTAELYYSSRVELTNKSIVSSAVLARSLLELASFFIKNANIIAFTLEKLDFTDGKIIVSSDLEKEIVRMIWGTRLGNPEDSLKIPNILNTLDSLSKNPNAADLRNKYEYLCEVAHPNVVGNANYWTHIENIDPDLSENRIMQQSAGGPTSRDICEHILWCLSWSGLTVKGGYQVIMDAVNFLPY